MKTTKTYPIHKGYPIFKSTPQLAKEGILNFMMARTKELGKTFKVDFGYIKIHVTSDPDFIKHVLQGNHTNYVKNRAYELLKLGLGNGLVTSEGSYWRKQRRIIQPVFYKKNLKNLYDAMVLETKSYLEQLDKKRGQTIDMSQEMMTVTANIVTRTLFTSDMPTDPEVIYESMHVMQEYVMSLVRFPFLRFLHPITGATRKFNRYLQRMDNLVFQLIDQRRKSEKKYPDLLQMLMDVEDEETGEKMTNQQLRDELITLFSAGHETSANALAWLWYLLTQHPEVVTKLKKEVDDVLNGELPTFEQLRSLTYNRQVIEEGMRLYPPAWVVGRKAKEEDEAIGYKIPPDGVVLCQIFIMHHDGTIWENPYAFNPDRFTPEKIKSRSRWHYLPFGAGPRMCIGNHFAMMEMQLLLAGLVQNFDFELVKNQKVEMDPLITLRSKYGIKMVVK